MWCGSEKSAKMFLMQLLVLVVEVRYAVSRTFSPGSVEVVKGRGHALPPPQFRGQSQETKFTKTRGQGQFLQTSQFTSQDTLTTQRFQTNYKSQFGDGGFQPRSNPYQRVQQRFTSGEDLVYGPPLGDLSNISYESNISYDRKGPVQVPSEWTNALNSNVYEQIQAALSSLEQYPDHIIHPENNFKLNEIELSRPSDKTNIPQIPVVYEDYPSHIFVDPGLLKKSQVQITDFSSPVGNQNGLTPVSTWYGEKQQFPTPVIYQSSYLDKLNALKNQRNQLTVKPSVSSFSPSTWLDIRPNLVRNHQQTFQPPQEEADIITIDNYNDVLSNLNAVQTKPEVYNFQVKTSYNARGAVPSV